MDNWDEFNSWLNRGREVGKALEEWTDSGLLDRIKGQPDAKDTKLVTGAIDSELEQHWKAWTDWLGEAPDTVATGLEEVGWIRGVGA
ncbi:MAG: hypothetical protein JSS68_14930 [Actinobacteria bacterium]|nr:hypothetical protein [Actinomycetota bacterium]